VARLRTGEWTRPVITTCQAAVAYCIWRANQRDLDVMNVVNSADAGWSRSIIVNLG
jgi:hypothetical protein